MEEAEKLAGGQEQDEENGDQDECEGEGEGEEEDEEDGEDEDEEENYRDGIPAQPAGNVLRDISRYYRELMETPARGAYQPNVR